MITLAAVEQLGNHEVHERAIIHVARGSVEFTSGATATTCGEGAVVLLEPGERHSLRASEHARILMTLAPWPGEGHYEPSEVQAQDPHRLRPGTTTPAQH
jgi:quercetin dioxygenase-like cupin family protein